MVQPLTQHQQYLNIQVMSYLQLMSDQKRTQMRLPHELKLLIIYEISIMWLVTLLSFIFIDPYLSENSTAYRRKHSCETTLLRLVEECKRAVDAKEEIAVLSTDRMSTVAVRKGPHLAHCCGTFFRTT